MGILVTYKLWHGSNFLSLFIKDGRLLVDSKLELYQERVLLLKHLKTESKFIMSMMQGH